MYGTLPDWLDQALHPACREPWRPPPNPLHDGSTAFPGHYRTVLHGAPAPKSVLQHAARALPELARAGTTCGLYPRLAKVGTTCSSCPRVDATGTGSSLWGEKGGGGTCIGPMWMPWAAGISKQVPRGVCLGRCVQNWSAAWHV